MSSTSSVSPPNHSVVSRPVPLELCFSLHPQNPDMSPAEFDSEAREYSQAVDMIKNRVWRARRHMEYKLDDYVWRRFWSDVLGWRRMFIEDRVIPHTGELRYTTAQLQVLWQKEREASERKRRERMARLGIKPRST